MDRRTRLVSFRLTEEEYRRLSADCLLHQGVSISSHTRTLVCDVVMKRYPTTESNPQEWQALQAMIVTLQDEIKEMKDLVMKLAASGGRTTSD